MAKVADVAKAKTDKMKVQIPPKLQVGAHWYELRFDQGLEQEGVTGSANHIKQVISINPARSDSARLEVLIHELIHAIVRIYGNNSPRLEEDTVNTLSEGLCQVCSQFDIELDWSLILNKQ